MIPTQEQTNWFDPREHFLWALRSLPITAGVGAITHPAILEGWSEHLWNCGFMHRDFLEVISSDGVVEVDDLPPQVVRFQQPVRGQRSAYNNAARWVSPDTPDPEPINLPDISKLTAQEQAAMVQQFVDAGLITTDQVKAEWLAAEVMDG